VQFHSTGPLSLISVQFSERKEPVKGARIVRGLRTLDRFFPFGNMDAEGKGAGGLRGLAPWRSMRQRLMRASSAQSLPLLEDALVVFRAIVATLPSAL